MSDKDTKTLAAMIAHRAIDIEVTEQIEKPNRLGVALEAFCAAMGASVEEQKADEEL